MTEIEEITQATNKIIDLHRKGLVKCRVSDYDRDVTVHDLNGKELARAYTTTLECNGNDRDWEYILQVDNHKTWKATASDHSWQGRGVLEEHIRSEKYRLARFIKIFERNKLKEELTRDRSIFNIENAPEKLKEILKEEALEDSMRTWAENMAKKCDNTIKLLNEQIVEDTIKTWTDDQKRLFAERMSEDKLNG